MPAPIYIRGAGRKHEREFLNDYFDTPGQLLTAIFLKGYQWPFDPRKVEEQGSSLIDLLVYQETVLKGRQVFLDFMHNPSPMMEGGNISFRYLTGEARNILKIPGHFWIRPING